MTTITEIQYNSLSDKIYNTLMMGENMGMGEMEDCRTASEEIIDTWMKENNITLE